MNLFEIIPENLFSVLSSPNKKTYMGALFVIKECYKQEMSMPKTQVASAIASKMEDEILELQMEDEEYENGQQEISIIDKAYGILRRLKWAGWLEFEMQGDNFEEYVILPDYSIEILNVLYSLSSKRNTEYSLYAYTTYSTLKIALDENRNQLYTAVMAAYENSNKLINSLKSLYNNLGRYYKKIIEKNEINAVLQEHFNDYKEYIDKIYHPLKTDDPVNLYKNPIKKMIDRIIGEDIIFEILIEQAMKSGNYEEEEKAIEDLHQKLFHIQDIYENISKNVRLVDNKNSEYIIATTRKVSYLLTSDKEQKGRMVNILRNAKKENTIKLMQEGISIFNQNYIDKDSIFLRSSKSEEKQGKPLAVEEIKIETDTELYEFLEKVNRSYTQEKVMEYMDKILAKDNYVEIQNIEITTDEEFILLMLGTMGEENAPYTIQYSGKYVRKGRYKIPDMIITRK